MADLITTLGNRDRILIDDYSVGLDTAYSGQKIEALIKTFDSVVRCSMPLVEPVGEEGTYDSTHLTILAGEIGERVLVTASNGLGTVTVVSGNVYTIKTILVAQSNTGNMPPGIIIFTAAANPAAQKLLPLMDFHIWRGSAPPNLP